MDHQNEIAVNGVNYTFKEEFDVNLTLTYENDNWEEWHILREFISNALDSVRGDTAKVSISSSDGYITIRDTGDGYPLVFAKRIGATNKKDDTDFIGNFGEGVKLSLLACVRRGIKVLLLSREWLIEPKAVLMENQYVLMYSIYETDTPVIGTTVVIEANAAAMEIIDNLGQYFLQFRSDNEILHGDMNSGIYPMADQKARLYNKGVYIKDITALYSYCVNLERLNRDRDLISNSDIAMAIKKIWDTVDSPCLIKPLIVASTWPYRQRNKLVELYYGISSVSTDAWATAFTELFGSKALLYTNDLAAREAMELGYDVVNCDYHISDILRPAGIRNDTETLADDYEFTYTDKLEHNEAVTLDKLYALVGLLDTDILKDVKVFEEYANHPDIRGIYSPRLNQVFLRKNLLATGVQEALTVYLHEVNHRISGSDDYSREFADSLCQMLSKLLLRYASEVGIKTTAQINGTDLYLPFQLQTGTTNYANFIAVGNRLFIYTPDSSADIELPLVLASPLCGIRKFIMRKDGYLMIKLPTKISAMLSYTNCDNQLNCVVKFSRPTVNSNMLEFTGRQEGWAV